MILSKIKCIVCGNEALLKHHSQVTCGKEKCRKQIHDKWRKKSLMYSKECLNCGTPFNTTLSAKKYCSKPCVDKITKLRNKMGAAHWARKKNGTYDKYARILREIGYTVIAPRGGVN